jgi:predicted RNase H-like HicB family nuclease
VRIRLDISVDREADGRWIAEAIDLPGVLAYGATSDAAVAEVERLAQAVLDDRLAHGEPLVDETEPIPPRRGVGVWGWVELHVGPC